MRNERFQFKWQFRNVRVHARCRWEITMRGAVGKVLEGWDPLRCDPDAMFLRIGYDAAEYDILLWVPRRIIAKGTNDTLVVRTQDNMRVRNAGGDDCKIG